MNLPAAILSAAVAVGAVWAIGALDDSKRPDLIAHELSLQPNSDAGRVAALYSEALRRDSANPYRWADLGDAFAQNDQLPAARYCFQRALDLNRRLPQIWLRDANFHFQLGETDAALASAARVLRTVPDYDGVLFNYFDQMIDSPQRVLAEIGGDRRSVVSYANHCIATAQVDAAREAWQALLNKGYADSRVTASYIDLLLKDRRYTAAEADWRRFTGASDSSNLVFNSGFEAEPSGAALDWRIRPADQFETAIDGSGPYEGKRSLHIRFLAGENVSYANVTQTVVVQAGSYELRAQVRTEGITTDEGPRLEVIDPESPARLHVLTEPFVGTRGWTSVTQRFAVTPATQILAVRVVRAKSAKFDNRIGGEFWLDSVRIERR